MVVVDVVDVVEVEVEVVDVELLVVSTVDVVGASVVVDTVGVMQEQPLQLQSYSSSASHVYPWFST